jgi:hypothetical protein
VTIEDGGRGHGTSTFEGAPDTGAVPTLEPLSQVSAVRARPDGTFEAELSSEWTVGGRPSGGYLLALLARVASSLAGSRDVVAASAHYLRSPEPGPVEIEGELLHSGRSVSQVRVRLSQGGRCCVEALLSAAELDPSAAPRWDAGVPVAPDVPFEDCFASGAVSPGGIPVSMLNHVDLRLDPEIRSIVDGRPSGRGRISGWIRLLGDDGFDPVSLMVAVDAFLPASFDTEFAAWMATVQMSVYVRALPAPGPVRVVSRARLIDPQWVDQTCDVWDGTGRLVAQATQLAKVFG